MAIEAAVFRKVHRAADHREGRDRPSRAGREVLVRTVGDRRVPQRSACRRRRRPVAARPADRARPRGRRHRRDGRQRRDQRAGRATMSSPVSAGFAATARNACRVTRTCAPTASSPARTSEAPRLSQDGQPVRQFIDISSYAEKMLLHENSLVRIDPDLPLDRAALVGCGVLDRGRRGAAQRRDSRPGRLSRSSAAAGSACRSSRARASAARGRSSRSTSSNRSARWRCASARPISSIRAEDDPVKAVRGIDRRARRRSRLRGGGQSRRWCGRRSRAWRSAAPRRSSECCRRTR